MTGTPEQRALATRWHLATTDEERDAIFAALWTLLDAQEPCLDCGVVPIVTVSDDHQVTRTANHFSTCPQISKWVKDQRKYNN